MRTEQTEPHPATDTEIAEWLETVEKYPSLKKHKGTFAHRLIARIKLERDRVRQECAEIAKKVSDDGHYYGDSSVDTASSIYRQGAFEVYESILSKVEGMQS